ncbi:MAG: zf-HC2 domain-containing protein [Nocardioides sp.]
MTASLLPQHPLLTQLADFVDGALGPDDRTDVQEHIDACRECRLRVQGAAGRVTVPAVALPADGPRVEADLRKLLWEEPPNPAPGQLWRLRWNDTTALGVVLRVEGDDVIVTPVGLDEWMADDYAVVVRPDWSPLHIGLSVWVALEAVVPFLVLDVYLGEADFLDQVAAVRQAYRQGRTVEDTVLVGPPVIEVTDERNQYRRQLALAFASLADAEWIDVAAPGGDGRSLVELMRGADPRSLAEVLGLDIRSTFVLMSGERVPTSAEAEVIAALIDADVDEVRAATPTIPPELAHELSHPRHRRDIERRAYAAGHGESDERRQALRHLLPVAARRAGDPEAPLDWRRLVDDYLDG